MVVKEFFGVIAGILILSGIGYALYRGDTTIKLVGQAGDSLSQVITAATPRG